MKVIFIHYSFDDDGVTRSVLNNIRGIREISGDFEFVLAGNSFSPTLPSYIEQRRINWDPGDIIDQLEKISSDVDFIIIENPTVGIFPLATKAFKEFSERNKGKRIIYRVHDFVDDRPHLFKDFLEVFDNFDSPYPHSENVSFFVLTNSDKERLLKKGLNNIYVVPNSIIAEDLVPDCRKAKELRQILEKENIVEPDEKIILYPVRILKRKNIEEALLIAKILGNKDKYHLIVTLPFEEEYREELDSLAKNHNIRCSLGKASRFIGFDKSKGFTIAELYSISDFVVSTSIREGFGFAFIEPWIAGTPVIGRKIKEVVKDFEESGINFDFLYDNSLLYADEKPEERIKSIRKILSEGNQLARISGIMKLEERKGQARAAAQHNMQKIKENYDYLNVARKFLYYLVPKSPVQLNF